MLIQSGSLAALLPLMGWGIADYFASRASRRHKTFVVNLSFAVYGIPLPLFICIAKGFPELSLSVIAGFLLASLFVMAGFLSMVRGFSGGSVGLVAPLANAYATVTLLVAVVFFKEAVHSRQLLAMGVIVASIVAISYQSDPLRKARTWFSLRYGFLAMMFFGVGFAVSGHYSMQTTWYGGQLVMSTIAVTLAALLIIIRHKADERQQIAKALKDKSIILGGTIGTVGALGFFAAVSLGATTVLAAAIASAAPLLTSYLAFRFDNESLSIKQRIGAIVIVACIMFLNLTR